MKIQDGSYLTLQSWMVTDLGLTGDELIIYAVIYSFSRDGAGCFYGTADYLAEWCGKSKNSVYTKLKKLVDSGLVEKRSEATKDGIRCEYRALRFESHQDQNSGRGDETLAQKLGNPKPKNWATPSPKIGDNNKRDNKRDKEGDSSINDAKGVLDHMNDALGTRFRPTETTIKAITARMRDGYSREELEQMVDFMISKWGSDPKMTGNLKPATLFRQSNCEGYVEWMHREGGGRKRKVRTFGEYFKG